MQEGYWDAASRTRTERFFVIDADTGETERYAMSTVAYEQEELLDMLSQSGIERLETFPSLSGHSAKSEGTHVIVGRARS